jgi:NitT/TauT family transport system substrate-binding protein
VLLSSREARGMITDVLVVKQSTIVKNPKLVAALVRGTLDGLAFMRREPAKAVAIIGKTLEIPPGEVQSELSNIENPPLAELDDVFKKSDALPSFYASGAIIGEILKKQGQIERLPAIADTYDSRFVAELKAGESR